MHETPFDNRKPELVKNNHWAANNPSADNIKRADLACSNNLPPSTNSPFLGSHQRLIAPHGRAAGSLYRPGVPRGGRRVGVAAVEALVLPAQVDDQQAAQVELSLLHVSEAGERRSSWRRGGVNHRPRPIASPPSRRLTSGSSLQPGGVRRKGKSSPPLNFIHLPSRGLLHCWAAPGWSFIMPSPLICLQSSSPPPHPPRWMQVRSALGALDLLPDCLTA